ncbi:hypothetical protein NC652_010281 [Populus alba x Populus x berolinensis]|nr:hypothetical protein NC652_010281 [Populus alba x Populus x berolinensis]
MSMQHNLSLSLDGGHCVGTLCFALSNGMEVADDATVWDLKDELYNSITLVGEPRLEFEGLILQDSSSLECYEIGDGDTIILRDMNVISVQLYGQSDKQHLPIVHRDDTIEASKQKLHILYGYVVLVNLRLRNRLATWWLPCFLRFQACKLFGN